MSQRDYDCILATVGTVLGEVGGIRQLLKPPRRRKPKRQSGRQSGSGWNAKDTRQLIGLLLFIIGLFMTLIGASQSYSDYTRLTSEQLAWKTIADTLTPELTVTGIGIFFTGLGLAIFFSSSNKDAGRKISRWFGH